MEAWTEDRTENEVLNNCNTWKMNVTTEIRRSVTNRLQNLEMTANIIKTSNSNEHETHLAF